MLEAAGHRARRPDRDRCPAAILAERTALKRSRRVTFWEGSRRLQELRIVMRQDLRHVVRASLEQLSMTGKYPSDRTIAQTEPRQRLLDHASFFGL